MLYFLRYSHNSSISLSLSLVTKKRPDFYNQVVSVLSFFTCCIVVSRMASTAAVSSCVSDCICSDSFLRIIIASRLGFQADQLVRRNIQRIYELDKGF